MRIFSLGVNRAALSGPSTTENKPCMSPHATQNAPVGLIWSGGELNDDAVSLNVSLA